VRPGDVEKRQDVLILKNTKRGQPAGNDLAEGAVTHAPMIAACQGPVAQRRDSGYAPLVGLRMVRLLQGGRADLTWRAQRPGRDR